MSAVTEIEKRYVTLVNDKSSLSCGGSINYAKPVRGEVCVDLGSGRGQDTIKLAKLVGEEGFAYGIDMTGKMIEKAWENSKKENLKNIDFLNSTMEKIPLEDNTIDLLISNCAINHASDKTAVWTEVYRVLKKGGRFVVSDIYSLKPVPKKYATDPVAVAQCWAGSVTKDVYIDTLLKAGFNNLTILEESEPYKKEAIEVVSYTIKGIKAG